MYVFVSFFVAFSVFACKAQRSIESDIMDTAPSGTNASPSSVALFLDQTGKIYGRGSGALFAQVYQLQNGKETYLGDLMHCQTKEQIQYPNIWCYGQRIRFTRIDGSNSNGPKVLAYVTVKVDSNPLIFLCDGSWDHRASVPKISESNTLGLTLNCRTKL